MPTISGELNFVSSRAAHVNEIWVRAPRVRTSTGGVVVTQNDRFPVKDGKVEFTCLTGPAILSLVSDGRAVDTIPIVVGESSSQTLRQAVAAAQVADEATRSEIEKLAAQAVHLIDTSTESATRAESARDRAETAASGAAQSAKKSADSATDSGKSAKASADSASAAKKSAGDASSSATAAKTAETKASSQASEAAKSATAAKKDADRAAGVADSTSWKGDQLTVNGKTSPHLTGPKGDQGDRGERGPKGTVEPGEVVPLPREEIDLSGVMEGATGDATLVINGGVSTLHLNVTPDFDGRSRVISYADWPKQYFCSRWIYSTIVSFTDDDFGLIQLASNNLYLMNVEAGKTYRGTLTYALEVDVSAMSGPMGPEGPKGDSGASTWADIKSKPSKFPPEDHKHKVAEISDLPKIDKNVSGDALVQRYGNGAILVPDPPPTSTSATSKAYVDARIQLVTSLPSKPDSDVLYVIAE